ncbi:MAG: hypothetical protein AABM31_12065, partial [Actinomycetota bacterium]
GGSAATPLAFQSTDNGSALLAPQYPAWGRGPRCFDLRDVVYEHLAADELAVVGVLAKLPWPTEWRHVQLMRTLV